ncbi:MAG: DUF222 domain-containing protein [Acidobacteria bacterium]|nr:DUF222 domain-containing protein [Acidobacteriota bacterium]
MLSRPGIDATSVSIPFGALPAGVAARNAPLQSVETPERLRPLAARLLESQLARLVRASATLERRLGSGLAALHAGQLYRHLGYVRAADYLTERLGMSLRRCQSLLRTERALRDLPTVAAALDTGALGASKVQIIAAAATPETQEIWLARAQRLTVRQLEELVRADRAEASGAGPGGAAAGPGGAAAGAAGPGDALPGTGGPGVQASPDEPCVPVSFAAPGRAVAMWHWALDLVRRVAGRQEPAWRCAEFLAAEYLSGAPSVPAVSGPAPEPAESTTTPGQDPPRQPGERDGAGRRQESGDSSGMEAWSGATQAVREALCSLGTAADPDAILAGRLPEISPAPANNSPDGPALGASGGRADPWDLDARLRALVRLRQSLVWRQGRLLRALAGYGLFKDLGFGSLGEFSAEVLGTSPRRARYLVSLDRRLDTLPLVRDAYRRGLVTWCQARLLIRVVRPGTESRWIRYARKVTVRRLEDVVTSCEVALALADAPAGGSDGESGNGRDRAGTSGPGPLPPIEPEPGARAWHTSAPRPADPPLPLAFAPGDSRTLQAGPAGRPAGTESRRAVHRIAFYAPPDVAGLWHLAVRACREAAGTHLREWECLLIFIQEMRDTWENPGDSDWRRRYRILERDGWRCKVPGCTSRSHLNAHHIIFRSHQGDNDEGNLVTLCGHHQAGIHQRRVRCSGRAPDALWWELGARPDGPPLARYFGDRIAGAGERPPGQG